MIRKANDIVIITQNEIYFQRAINEMEEILTTFKVKINEKNTKIPICARKSQNIVVDLYLDNYKLEQVSEFLCYVV